MSNSQFIEAAGENAHFRDLLIQNMVATSLSHFSLLSSSLQESSISQSLFNGPPAAHTHRASCSAQQQYRGFLKSFAVELKPIFQMSFKVIRFKLVTFSEHKIPDMFYSLSVYIFEVNISNSFRSWEIAKKSQPIISRCFVVCFDSSFGQVSHCFIAPLNTRLSCSREHPPLLTFETLDLSFIFQLYDVSSKPFFSLHKERG